MGEGTMIGTGASVLPGVAIGDQCIIGAGAVVNRDIPSGSLAYGVPARVKRTQIDRGRRAEGGGPIGRTLNIKL
jgi:acetyltransferase-like isoleucine patch superfamily enzyme